MATGKTFSFKSGKEQDKNFPKKEKNHLKKALGQTERVEAFYFNIGLKMKM